MYNLELLQTFEEVASLLNRKFNSIPILYGSLGLAQYIPSGTEPNDIDILIEQDLFVPPDVELESALAEIGFVLADASENEYQSSSCRLGFAGDGDLWKFAQVDISSLSIVGDSCKYRILRLEDYRRVYEASSKDGYRKDVRGKRDQQKLELISQRLRTTCS